MTAAMLLRSGEADAVLAVGGESILCPIVVSGSLRPRHFPAETTTPSRRAARSTLTATASLSVKAAALS